MKSPVKGKSVKQLTFKDMWLTVLRNQVIQIIMIYVACKQSDYISSYDMAKLFFINPERREQHAVFIILSLIISLLLFETLFYFGHLLLHKQISLYQRVHKTHHNTFATVGVSAHYMDWWDFFFESAFPFTSTVLLMMPLGASRASLVIGTGMAAYNTVMVHSGWVFPVTADPRWHWQHHSKLHVNYGTGPMDYVFGTVSG